MSALRRYSLHLAAIALAVLYVVLGHLDYWPGSIHGNVPLWELHEPRLSGGDEPHYKMIVHSLLFDRDVRLDEDFARIEAGGYDGGFMTQGDKSFGGHTLIVDKNTGKHVACIVKCTDAEYAAIGVPKEQTFQVPSHPLGYPFLVALILFPLRPSPAHVEPLMGFLSMIFAVLGVLLTYTAAIRSGLDRRHALLAAFLLGFASSWIVYLRSYFSDPSIGLFVLLGYVALRRGAHVRAGLAVGVALSMKAVFVLVGFAWILERLWARRWRDALVLTATVGTCGLVVIASNMILLRTPFVGGALPLGFASGLTSLRETLFEDEHGLFTFVPWTFIPMLWGPWAGRPGARVKSENDDEIDGGDTREANRGTAFVSARRQMTLTIFFCLAVFAAIGFGPGWCYGPRYYVPLFPFFAILAADFVASGRRWRAGVVGVLGLVSALIAVPSVPQYHWIFSKRPFAGITGPR